MMASACSYRDPVGRRPARRGATQSCHFPERASPFQVQPLMARAVLPWVRGGVRVYRTGAWLSAD